MSPLTIGPDGHVSWTPAPGDYYLVTGTTRAGKRFRFKTDRWLLALAINAYRGNYWLVRDGRRYRIQSRYN